ncbi:MAG: hypothetical protein LBB79_09060, partial [Prevotellaceae bacterium]|nr:hypothetical protein [Prevotellaceae bacterium]
ILRAANAKAVVGHSSEKIKIHYANHAERLRHVRQIQRVLCAKIATGNVRQGCGAGQKSLCAYSVTGF